MHTHIFSLSRAHALTHRARFAATCRHIAVRVAAMHLKPLRAVSSPLVCPLLMLPPLCLCLPFVRHRRPLCLTVAVSLSRPTPLLPLSLRQLPWLHHTRLHSDHSSYSSSFAAATTATATAMATHCQQLQQQRQMKARICPQRRRHHHQK
jgi:hypothetical protein